MFAQLYTPDGECQGLHSFVVPIRDPLTLLPLPGVTIGDMGHKVRRGEASAQVGLNGLDNGWMMFDRYEVAREMLLNKTGDVTEEGEYRTPYRVGGVVPPFPGSGKEIRRLLGQPLRRPGRHH